MGCSGAGVGRRCPSDRETGARLAATASRLAPFACVCVFPVFFPGGCPSGASRKVERSVTPDPTGAAPALPLIAAASGPGVQGAPPCVHVAPDDWPVDVLTLALRGPLLFLVRFAIIRWSRPGLE